MDQIRYLGDSTLALHQRRGEASQSQVTLLVIFLLCNNRAHYRQIVCAHSSVGGARGSPASLQHLEDHDEAIGGMPSLLSSMQHKCHRHLLYVADSLFGTQGRFSP